ncbi:MAG: homoserine kinase [Gemmatimonadota bacterium]
MIRIRVPCSTSNLGAGFDCIGLAFQRFLTIEYTAESAGQRGGAPGMWLVEPQGTAVGVGVGDDLITRTVVAELQRIGVAIPPGNVRVDSDIPLRRGLGSSAAATVGGLLLARAITGDPDPDREELLQLAASSEGHPDNVAPALLGGLVAIARDVRDRFYAFRLPLSDQIGFAFAAPDVEVSTPAARQALPQHIEFAAGVRTAGRMAALVHGLAGATPKLLRIGFSDELHVPYRLSLIPHAAEAFEAAVSAGAWAATISGSGSGLIAVCPRGRESAVAAAMAGALQVGQASGEACSFEAVPALTGATIQIEG